MTAPAYFPDDDPDMAAPHFEAAPPSDGPFAPPRPWLRTPPTLEDVLAASLLDAYGRCQYCGSDDDPCQCWEAVAEREADANDAALDRAREEGRA